MDDSYTLQSGETEVKPVDGLCTPITWNGTAWVGTDQATWQAAQDAAQAEYLKANPVTPSAEQLAINTLGQALASVSAQLTSVSDQLAQASTAPASTAETTSAESTATEQASSADTASDATQGGTQ
ncbi:hypothetical protein FD16_GL002215 [Paucilactobacillus suebicus DSM 5007 = KCTC 3549]|uniref:Uncharacterized protein n=1 Tax=Paucilactobacillus suebicus DSM 5007 = KCTC 3549 TaxID=1423807 RepID=A0A0R1W391_9LACO|nr:hypothetical protein FD16_GL002215 [Paucilactobacillus suebicus DSM 5007 = KCTC 3549]